MITFLRQITKKQKRTFYILYNILRDLALSIGMLCGNLRFQKVPALLLPSRKIIWWQRGDGIEILKLKDGSYYHLDEVGARIWELLNEQKKIEETMDIIGEEYEIEKEEVKKDIVDLINVFKRANLIQYDLI